MNLTNNIYLLLGSNLGAREAYIKQAKELIENDLGQIHKTSSLYETAAWGETDQPDFINQVILVASPYSPRQVLEKILAIERQLDRTRIKKWAARTIDIDILFYNNESLNEVDLIIPHPYLHLRSFTVIPLAEIAPHFYHPVLGKTMRSLCQDVSDHLSVHKLTTADMQISQPEKVTLSHL